jgi:hypothetical protein
VTGSVPAALAALIGANLRRLLRESIVQRALGFPVVLTIATLLGTLVVVSVSRGVPVVALGEGATQADEAVLSEPGLRTVRVADPVGMVTDGDAIAAWVPPQLATPGGRDAIEAERRLRTLRGAPWHPVTAQLPGIRHTKGQGFGIASLLVAIFTLYGVVFGAGMVARDRDDGTLEVELAMAVPRWVHGLARWLSAAAVLGAFVALSIAMVAAMLGLPDAAALTRHGVAAALGSVALGLGSVGRAGINSGFAATLAAGLSVATGLLGLGWWLPVVGAWLPLASVAAGGAGWAPLVGSVALGLAGIGLFTWRSARA